MSASFESLMSVRIVVSESINSLSVTKILSKAAKSTVPKVSTSLNSDIYAFVVSTSNNSLRGVSKTWPSAVIPKNTFDIVPPDTMACWSRTPNKGPN